MTRKAAFTALLAALALAPAAALHAQQPSAEAKAAISTGYWKFETKLLGLTVDSEFKCVEPADLDNFFAGPCNKGHTCTYPVREVEGGRGRRQGFWDDRGGKRANVSANGTYSAKRLELNASGTLTNGLPLALTLLANWQAETCPAGAKH